MLTINVEASSFSTKILYWYSQNVSTNVPDLKDIVSMKYNRSNGKGRVFTWMIANPPTKAELVALDDATVDAWVKSTTETAKSETVYTTDQGLFLRAFIAELKKKNPALVMPSKAEVKAKFIELKNN